MLAAMAQPALAAQTATEIHVVLGATGTVGRAVVERLKEVSRENDKKKIAIRLVSRSGKAPPADGASQAGNFLADAFKADLMDPKQAIDAVRGARYVYLCVEVAWDSYGARWPTIMSNVIAACEKEYAVLAFADSTWAYGKRGAERSLLEGTTPVHEYGHKPGVRARLSYRLLEAEQRGKLRSVTVRAAELYGPGVTNGLLGADLLDPLISSGRTPEAGLPFPSDKLHSVTHVRDFARALVDAARKPQCYNKVYHVPCARAEKLSDFFDMVARAAGHAAPGGYPQAGFWSTLLDSRLRAVGELSLCLFEQNCVLDSQEFRKVFGWEAIPLEEGVPECVEWHKGRLEKERRLRAAQGKAAPSGLFGALACCSSDRRALAQIDADEFEQ